MALRDMFNRVKVIVGGMRSDVAPVVADGHPAPLRLNADSELFVTVGSTVGTRDESAQVWAADTNVAATTTYYPSPSGYEIGNRDQLVIQLTMTDNTTTIEASNDGTTWVDVTPTVLDMETGTYLNASFACGAGASDNWMLDLDGFGPRYVRCAVLTPGAGNAAGIIAFTRKR